MHDLLVNYRKAKELTVAPRSRTTYRERIIHLERFLADHNPSTLLAEDFDKVLMDEYVNLRLQNGINPITINNEITHINSIFNWAISRNLVKTNPLKGFVRLRTVQNEPVFLEEEEVTKILKHANPKYQTIFALMVYTGIRKGECARLEWSDIDMRRKTLAVRNKLGSPTKTGAERQIPLADPIVEMLQKLHKEDNYVFPRLQNEPSLRNGLRTTFIRTVKRAGIPIKRGNRNITLKSLRSTFASLLARRGANPALVQKLLGHTDIKMTLRYYVNLRPEEAHDVVSKLHF
jgi:integrase